MADRFYRVDLGAGFPDRVTEGASSSGNAIEIRVNSMIYASKIAALIGIDAIRNYVIVKETTPNA